jgi:hypothetical protein
MDIERAAEDFVRRGKVLFDQLRSEGEALSDLGVRVLLTQLHILNVEVTRLKHTRQFSGKGIASTTSPKEKAPTEERLEKKGSKPACLHRRLINDFVNGDGQRTTLVSCLECGAIIKDPLLK